MQPTDQEVVAAALRDARWRLGRVSGMRGAAGGLSIAALLQLTGGPARGLSALNIGMLIVAGLLGLLLGLWSTSQRRRMIAATIEARAAGCDNLLVTAEELLQQEHRTNRFAGASASPYLTALVFRDARALLDRLNFATLFPTVPTQVALGGATLLSVLALLQSELPSVAGALTPLSSDIADLWVTTIPPDYLKQLAVGQKNPDRIQALAGSKVTVTVHTGAATVSLETVSGSVDMVRDSAGFFSVSTTADADGFLAIEGRAADQTPGLRRLIGLSVTADLPPQVQITKPGEDLHLLDGNKTLNLVIHASDDIGLASLRLRYVHVSGSGERYTFREGEVPLSIAHTDSTHWVGTAAWRLNPLALEAGDVVVYRALVTDHRPGAPPTESDSYLAEVLSPGSLAGGGFETDPEVERYALSQQMIILKTERLLANAKSMTTDSFADVSATVGLEQRSVRAAFVFMMGGEIAAASLDMTTLDEAAEAAGEGDMMVGHAKNQGRDALTRATRAMSRAATLLNEGKPTEALPLERDALVQLEMAFSHSRILLRALTVQERLDPTRRLTGALVDAASQQLPPLPEVIDPTLVAARSVLATMATLAGQSLGDSSGRAASRLAERVLRIDPSAAVIQSVASRLVEAASAAGQQDQRHWHERLDQAATLMTAHVKALLIPVKPSRPTMEAQQLGGAVNDARRRGGGSP